MEFPAPTAFKSEGATAADTALAVSDSSVFLCGPGASSLQCTGTNAPADACRSNDMRGLSAGHRRQQSALSGSAFKDMLAPERI